MTQDEILHNFYTAFSNLDAEKMVNYYHEAVIFEDPAFGILEGKSAKNMWRMLCKSQKGKGFRVIFNSIQSNNNLAQAKWEAFYTFSKTGRKVHNIINAQFEFKDGKIIKHTDDFSLHEWATQALGLKGFLLGWLPFFKSKLQAQTHRLLNQFEQSL